MDGAVLDSIITVGVVVALILSGATFLVQMTTRWWRTRAGVAFWSFNTAFLFLAIHFGLEEVTGIQNQWRELIVIVGVCATLGWALWTVVFKRFFWSSDNPEWDPLHIHERQD